MGSMGKLPTKFYNGITFVMAFAFILGTQVLKEHEHLIKLNMKTTIAEPKEKMKKQSKKREINENNLHS